MYIAISAQKTGATYQNSVSDYVAYLEKENEENEVGSTNQNPQQSYFFTQDQDRVEAQEVIEAIDQNTAKLRKRDPRFYSLIISPSQRELKYLQNDPEKLKNYTREVMTAYAASFHRNEPVTADQLLYFAKIEYTRTYRGFEKEILKNRPYIKKIARLKNQIRQAERGELNTDPNTLKAELQKTIDAAPHKRNGKLLQQGMKKEGLQTHVHIIVSRRDKTNTYTLSPLSKHKASEVILNGKAQKRGFNREGFYQKAEVRFDKMSTYPRHYTDSFKGRNMHTKDPFVFFAKLAGLPANEKAAAMKLLAKTGNGIPTIPTNKVQLALKTLKTLKRGVKVAIHSGGIEI
jgi:hypothetical protein